jgi:hypothetical protein
VLPVGAFRGRAAKASVRGNELAAGAVTDYSGQPTDPAKGAQRSYLPFAAVADAGKRHPGIRAIGNRADTLRRMNGTSVAAPQVARFVAIEMAKGGGRSAIVGGLPAARARSCPDVAWPDAQSAPPPSAGSAQPGSTSGLPAVARPRARRCSRADPDGWGVRCSAPVPGSARRRRPGSGSSRSCARCCGLDERYRA